MKTVRMLYLIFANAVVLMVLTILGAHLVFKTYFILQSASAGALDAHAKHAYIDESHCSADASKLLAQAIAESIRGKNR